MARNKLSWRPVREGDRFCAPACGRGCTHAEYVDALTKAAAVVKSLGPGWKPVVSENLGWYYSVEHVSGMKVHCSAGPSYWADIGVDNRQYHSDHFSDAAEAVQVVVDQMRQHSHGLALAVARLGNPKRRAKR